MFEQPVIELVNVKIAVPAPIPVTRPPPSTVATEIKFEDHVPPVLGVAVVVPPIQIDEEAIVRVGKAFIKTFDVVLLQPVEV